MKAQFFIISLIVLLSVVVSCKKKRLNEDLYQEAKDAGLFYKGKDTIYNSAGGSPHGPFKLKFNSTAVSQFGSDGKLPVGASFQNGSLIVKELYSGGVLTLYVVMKKDDSKFSGNGWLWAEYETDGKAKYSVGDKGKDCISCHSQSNNRDLTKSFDLH